MNQLVQTIFAPGSSPLAFLNNFGGWETILIVVLILILFGGRRIPQLAKDLGQGIREFKNAITGKGGESEKIDKKDDSDQA